MIMTCILLSLLLDIFQSSFQKYISPFTNIGKDQDSDFIYESIYPKFKVENERWLVFEINSEPKDDMKDYLLINMKDIKIFPSIKNSLTNFDQNYLSLEEDDNTNQQGLGKLRVIKTENEKGTQMQTTHSHVESTLGSLKNIFESIEDILNEFLRNFQEDSSDDENYDKSLLEQNHSLITQPENLKIDETMKHNPETELRIKLIGFTKRKNFDHLFPTNNPHLSIVVYEGEQKITEFLIDNENIIQNITIVGLIVSDLSEIIEENIEALAVALETFKNEHTNKNIGHEETKELEIPKSKKKKKKTHRGKKNRKIESDNNETKVEKTNESKQKIEKAVENYKYYCEEWENTREFAIHFKYDNKIAKKPFVFDIRKALYDENDKESYDKIKFSLTPLDDNSQINFFKEISEFCEFIAEFLCIIKRESLQEYNKEVFKESFNNIVSINKLLKLAQKEYSESLNHSGLKEDGNCPMMDPIFIISDKADIQQDSEDEFKYAAQYCVKNAPFSIVEELLEGILSDEFHLGGFTSEDSPLAKIDMDLHNTIKKYQIRLKIFKLNASKYGLKKQTNDLKDDFNNKMGSKPNVTNKKDAKKSKVDISEPEPSIERNSYSRVLGYLAKTIYKEESMQKYFYRINTLMLAFEDELQFFLKELGEHLEFLSKRHEKN